MKMCLIVAVTWVLMYGIATLLVAASIGSPDMSGFALAGVGQTAPAPSNIYPDFVVRGLSNYSYLIFGGDYDKEDDWDGANWRTNVDYLKFKYSTEDDGKWLGFAVGAAGDVTGDGEDHRDVLIGDTRYLDIWDPDDAQGKAWLIHGIFYTSNRPTITLSAGGGFPYCEVTEISSDQGQNWFGCSMGWAGDLKNPPMTPSVDDFIIGASLWDDTTNSKTDVGRAYIFLGDDSMPTSLDTDDGVAITGEYEFDHFGCAVVGIDGFDSGITDAVAVGASWYDKTSGGSVVENNCGRVYIFEANANLSAMSAADANAIITGDDGSNEGDFADSFFGCAVASGDFVSGGGEDLAVGAYGYDGYKGRVYVFSAATLSGGGNFDLTDATYTFTGSAGLDLFGTSVANARDFFGGEARDALIVGAPGYSDGLDPGYTSVQLRLQRAG
ncbi:MAG: hypothetical protein JW759_10595 [Candidatus Coatesbacteria bacterium]|nr:hypothetical protein [Candidatus Coatesbacteria bacterium]